VLIALVLTGMVQSSKLQVGDPLAFVFGPEGANLPWLRGVVAISALVAMTTVLLVFQLGQPRIWMSMSRDGLLPPIFSAIHPRFKTPWFATLMTGLLVSVPALFMNLTEVTDLTSIGTLFAFVLVSAGVLLLNGPKSGRYVKYVDSRWIIPPLYVATWLYALIFQGGMVSRFFSFTDPNDPSIHGWAVFKHQIPLLAFLVGSAVLAVLCYTRRLSLIPVIGVLTCGYLMTELGITNWMRFAIWLIIGMVVYFSYGVRKSRLAQVSA
jgi:amino acid transporter